MPPAEKLERGRRLHQEFSARFRHVSSEGSCDPNRKRDVVLNLLRSQSNWAEFPAIYLEEREALAPSWSRADSIR
jgi:hypothetical protein